MRKLALAVFGCAAAAAAVVPVAPAAAEQPTVAGRHCSFASITDPSVEDGSVQVGEINGGPVAAVDLPVVDPDGDPTMTWDVLGNPVELTLTCTVRLGFTHTSPAAVSAAASGTGVVVLAPTPVTYGLDPWEFVTICAEVSVRDAHGNSAHYYWDELYDRYTTNSGAWCLNGDPDYFGAVFRLIDEVFTDVVDPLLCAQLASLAPGVPGVVDIESDGDLYVAGEWTWECPPYEW